MPEMDIRRSGIETGLYDQGFLLPLRALQFLYEFVLGDYLLCAAPQKLNVVLDHTGHPYSGNVRQGCACPVPPVAG